MAVSGGNCNLDQEIQLVQLVTQKAKGKDTLKPLSFPNDSGYRVKFQWIWTVSSSCYTTEAWELLTWCFYMSGPGWVPAKSPRNTLQLQRSCQACTKGYQTAIAKWLAPLSQCSVEKLRFLMEFELPANERSPVTAKPEIAY